MKNLTITFCFEKTEIKEANISLNMAPKKFYNPLHMKEIHSTMLYQHFGIKKHKSDTDLNRK